MQSQVLHMHVLLFAQDRVLLVHDSFVQHCSREFLPFLTKCAHMAPQGSSCLATQIVGGTINATSVTGIAVLIHKTQKNCQAQFLLPFKSSVAVVCRNPLSSPCFSPRFLPPKCENGCSLEATPCVVMPSSCKRA